MRIISLKDILEAFNDPLNEEQGWAIAYQASQHLHSLWKRSKKPVCRPNGFHNVLCYEDGEVTINYSSDTCDNEAGVVEALGAIIFNCLDYTVDDSRERTLSHSLQSLLHYMAGAPQSDSECEDSDLSACREDEGIEHDKPPSPPIPTLSHVLTLCSERLEQPSDAASHYKAVIRALVSEYITLQNFLEQISDKEQLLGGISDENPHLEDLRKRDWAHLWLQLMHQLRCGVQLRRVSVNLQPKEYELTPFEILLDDIRNTKYQLKNVEESEERITPRVKHDAHNVLLEFIRSRPPLKPASQRQLKPPPPAPVNRHSALMGQIKSPGVTLKHIPCREVETSRTRLFDSQTDVPIRKLIKPQMDLFHYSLPTADEGEGTSNAVTMSTPADGAKTLGVSPALSGSQGALLGSTPRRPPRRAASMKNRRISIGVCESPDRKMDSTSANPQHADTTRGLKHSESARGGMPRIKQQLLLTNNVTLKKRRSAGMLSPIREGKTKNSISRSNPDLTDQLTNALTDTPVAKPRRRLRRAESARVVSQTKLSVAREELSHPSFRRLEQSAPKRAVRRSESMHNINKPSLSTWSAVSVDIDIEPEKPEKPKPKMSTGVANTNNSSEEKYVSRQSSIDQPVSPAPALNAVSLSKSASSPGLSLLRRPRSPPLRKQLSLTSTDDEVFQSDSSCAPSSAPSVERLSAAASPTIQQVKDVRRSITNAELDALRSDKDSFKNLYQGKMCFACKKTKLGTMFKPKGKDCYFCCRKICNHCITQMRMPGELTQLKVSTLTPAEDLPKEENSKKWKSTSNLFSGVRRISTASDKANNNKDSNGITRTDSCADLHSQKQRKKTRRISRQQSLSTSDLSHPALSRFRSAASAVKQPASLSLPPDEQPAASPPYKPTGPVVLVCVQCRDMLCEIIREGRFPESTDPSIVQKTEGARRLVVVKRSHTFKDF